MHRRAQAAMEFLMTYGWAILVVLAAVAALAAFGVLSLDKILPESCKGATDIPCLEKAGFESGVANAGSITFALRNNVGSRITVTGINGSGAEGVSQCIGENPYHPAISDNIMVNNYTVGDTVYNITANATVADNSKILWQITCTEDTENVGRLSQDFKMHYITQNGVAQKALITIKAKP